MILENDCSDTILSRNDLKWEVNFVDLKQYTEENKGKFPPYNMRLGNWVDKQRIKYRNSLLSNERILKLESIGILWNPIVNVADGWNSHFNEFVQYLENNKGAYPKWSTSLGKWVGHQRDNNNNSRLSQERIDKLNSIGFKWSGIKSYTWDTYFDELKHFLEEHDGFYPLPDTKLGKWVFAQHKEMSLSCIGQDKIDKLNSIEFVWIKYYF